MNRDCSIRRFGPRTVLKCLDNASRRILGKSLTPNSTPVQNRNNINVLSRNTSRRQLNELCSPISKEKNRVVAAHSEVVQSAVKKTLRSIVKLANLPRRRNDDGAQSEASNAPLASQDEISTSIDATEEVKNDDQAPGEIEQVADPEHALQVEAASTPIPVPIAIDENPPVAIDENPPPYSSADRERYLACRPELYPFNLRDTFDLLYGSDSSDDDDDNCMMNAMNSSNSFEGFDFRNLDSVRLSSGYSSIDRHIVSSPMPGSRAESRRRFGCLNRRRLNPSESSDDVWMDLPAFESNRFTQRRNGILGSLIPCASESSNRPPTFENNRASSQSRQGGVKNLIERAPLASGSNNRAFDNNNNRSISQRRTGGVVDLIERAPWASENYNRTINRNNHTAAQAPVSSHRPSTNRTSDISPYRSREYYWRPMDARTPPIERHRRAVEAHLRQTRDNLSVREPVPRSQNCSSGLPVDQLEQALMTLASVEAVPVLEERISGQPVVDAPHDLNDQLQNVQQRIFEHNDEHAL